MSFVISLSHFRYSARQNCKKSIIFSSCLFIVRGRLKKHCMACDGAPAWTICERTRLEQRHRALKITSICQCVSLGSGAQSSPIRLTPSPYAHVLTLTGTTAHAEQGSSGSRQGLPLHAGISPSRAESTTVGSAC